jgi:MFS transporter, PAT family, beta-lactamase induction signal transducer AmpG
VNLAQDRTLRTFTLCVLYVAQGIPWGFMATTLPGYLKQNGVDAEIVGAMLSFTTLPYAFKWVWGPIIDTFTLPRFGRRRPWIIFAQAMMALTVVALVTFDLGTEIKLLTWTILIHTVFNSLQDVSVDAMATDLLDDNERGRANGLMYGSKYFGGLIGGVFVAKLIVQTNLETALIAQTIVLCAIMLVPIFVKERETNESDNLPAARVRSAPAQLSFRQTVSGLAEAFSVRSTIVAALLMLVANFAIGCVAANGYELFIGRLGWTYDELAVITGGWGLVVGGVCAGLTGFLVDKLGRRTVAAIACCALAAGWITFSQLESHWDNHTLVYVAAFWEGAWQAIVSVALISLCMDLSSPKVAGSQFAAYMALSNFSTTLGYQFAARIQKELDFVNMYIAMGILQVSLILLLLPIDPKELRRSIAEGATAKRGNIGLVAFLLLVAFLIYMTIKKTIATVG